MIAIALLVDDFPSVVVNGNPYYYNDNKWKKCGLTVYTEEEAQKVVALFAQHATRFPEWSRQPDE